MANETRKLGPVALSELPIIDEPKGFWIFGSKEDTDSSLVSGRYLFDRLEEYARNLQLERRISITMQDKIFEMFIGEEMEIYKIVSENVKTLSINKNEIDDFETRTLDIKVDKGSMLTLSVERENLDPTAYLFIYAKAKVV